MRRESPQRVVLAWPHFAVMLAIIAVLLLLTFIVLAPRAAATAGA
jgi:hypothetical protein